MQACIGPDEVARACIAPEDLQGPALQPRSCRKG